MLFARIALISFAVVAASGCLFGEEPQPGKSAEELNRNIPPLGGKDAEDRIRKLIEETCRGPTNEPATSAEVVWSEAVGGLRSRIVYFGQGSYSDCVAMVGLRNVSSNALVVPTGFSAHVRGTGIFDLQGRSSSGPWLSIDAFGATNEPATSARGGESTAVLPPGQEATICLNGRGSTALRHASEVRIIIRQDAANAPDGGWHGILETPPVAAWWSGRTIDRMKGCLPFPSVFPPFDRNTYFFANMSAHEAAVNRLKAVNRSLLYALRFFRADGIREAFERRMVAEKSEPMKMMFASVAAGEGSQAAALYLLESLKSTDYCTIQNVHCALHGLIHHYYDKQQPRWLVAMVEAALSDKRYVTGLKEVNFADETLFTLSHMAIAQLAFALAAGEKQRATPFLLQMVKSVSDAREIEALGVTGDPRAIPALLDIVRTTGQTSRDDERRELSIDIFRESVKALGSLGAAEAVPVLAEHLEFVEVVEALEWIGDSSALAALRKVLQAGGKVVQDGKELRPEAARDRLAKARIALARLEEGDVVPRLCALLRDKSLEAFDRWTVVGRLGGTTDPRAVPFLVQTIRTDPSGAVVNHAITVLSGFKCRAAIEGLIDCFDADLAGKADGKRSYEPEMLQDNIAQSLRTITGRDLGPDKKQWVEWWQREGRTANDLK